MSPRILGYGVLVYAAFKFDAGMGLASIIFGGWDAGRLVSSWVLLGNSVLWFAFVSGGVGLIFGKSWSRLVLLFAAAVSVVLGILGMVFLSVSDIPREVVLLNALVILPPVAILVGTLSLGAPAARPPQPSSGPVAKRAVTPRIDLAYGCFAWIAFEICAGILLFNLPLDFSTGQGLQMLLGIPVLLSTLAAGLGGVVLSIVEWREWPLMTMSAASISQVFLVLAADGTEGFIDTWGYCVTAILVFLCVRWFAFARRRATQTQATDER